MPGGRRPLGPANGGVTEDWGSVILRIKEDLPEIFKIAELWLAPLGTYPDRRGSSGSSSAQAGHSPAADTSRGSRRPPRPCRHSSHRPPVARYRHPAVPYRPRPCRPLPPSVGRSRHYRFRSSRQSAGRARRRRLADRVEHCIEPGRRGTGSGYRSPAARSGPPRMFGRPRTDIRSRSAG